MVNLVDSITLSMKKRGLLENDPESYNSGADHSWVGIFTNNGEMVQRVCCKQALGHYTEAIDKTKLMPGSYFVIIMKSDSIQTDKFEIV
jgi:hypothetical protein